MLGAVPRGWQIQAYLSTDVDRITVAKPFTECNIVFAMFLQCTPMSSTLLLTVSTRLLVRMNGGLFSTLYFVLLLPAARQDDVLPCNRTKQHTQQHGRLFRLCGCFMRFFSDTRAHMSSHGSHQSQIFQLSVIAPGRSRTQATDVELVRVAMPRKTEQCF